MRSRRKGFTLLEMLVTLVVVSMVASVLWQALFQLSQVEQRLNSRQLQSSTVDIRVEWLRLALAGLLAGGLGSAERFAGAERELTGLSTAVPQYPGAGLEPLRLTLRFNSDSGQTELLLHDAVAAMSLDSRSRALLSWPGQKGRFRYQDARGAWQDSWPPKQPDAAALPSLIVLETGLDGYALIVVASQVSEVDWPSRAILERL